MTIRLLRGVRPETIPLELTGRNRYMFDYGQLAKFGVSPGLVPADSVIVNEPVSLYSQHKALVLGVGAFIAVLLAAIIGLNINIIKRKKAEKELQVYATTDQMTGLCNRRTGLVSLAEQLAVAEAQKTKLAICFLDIDGLKTVNDNYGHYVGDMLIKAVSQVLAESVGDHGKVCRFGGDEFLVVLPDCGRLQAEALFAGIKHKLAETKIGHYDWRPGISCGFAEYDPAKPVSMDELIRVADDKMYARKKGKKKGYI
jgi:diguanylate cyclase (GGDEF)-like protein